MDTRGGQQRYLGRPFNDEAGGFLPAPTAIKAPIKSKPAHPSASKKWRNGNSSVHQAYRTNDSMHGPKRFDGNGASVRFWHGQSRPPQFAHMTMKKKSPGKAKNTTQNKRMKARPSRLQPKPSAENVLDSMRGSGDSSANIGAESGSEPRPEEGL